MDIMGSLQELKEKCRNDVSLRKKLLSTKEQENSLDSFCRIARDEGIELYPIDVINLGDEVYAAMRRSTNGGGENSPLLTGEDDYYEMFMLELSGMK